VVDQLRTTNSAQEAYVIRPTAAPMRPVLHYRLEAFDGDPPAWIWAPPATRYVIPSAKLQSYITKLVAAEAWDSYYRRRKHRTICRAAGLPVGGRPKRDKQLVSLGLGSATAQKPCTPDQDSLLIAHRPTSPFPNQAAPQHSQNHSRSMR
jgi:hypothetical protein